MTSRQARGGPCTPIVACAPPSPARRGCFNTPPIRPANARISPLHPCRTCRLTLAWPSASASGHGARGEELLGASGKLGAPPHLLTSAHSSVQVTKNCRSFAIRRIPPPPGQGRLPLGISVEGISRVPRRRPSEKKVRPPQAASGGCQSPQHSPPYLLFPPLTLVLVSHGAHMRPAHRRSRSTPDAQAGPGLGAGGRGPSS